MHPNFLLSVNKSSNGWSHLGVSGVNLKLWKLCLTINNICGIGELFILPFAWITFSPDDALIEGNISRVFILYELKLLAFSKLSNSENI